MILIMNTIIINVTTMYNFGFETQTCSNTKNDNWEIWKNVCM